MHEFNGHRIVLNHLPEDPLRPVVAHMMGKTLAADPALRGIKSLIDAVIDADRMDFVLRDGLTSGGEFGHYGQERLVKSFRIYVDRTLEGKVREIFIRPSTEALSAVESLLQERYKIYRWVHFHPRVVMATAFFRYALAEANQLGYLDAWWFRAANYCAPEGWVSEPPGPVEEDKRPRSPYILLGDSFVEARLEKLLGEIERGEAKLEPVAANRLRAALRGLLVREKWSVPLWKRLDDYRDFGEELREQFRRKILTQSEVHGNPTHCLGRYAMEAKGGRKFLNDVQDRLNSANQGDWYLLEATVGFKVKGDDRIVSTATGVLNKLSGTPGVGQEAVGLSAVAPAIEYAWRRDIFLYAFLVSDRPLVGRVAPERIAAARKRVAEAFAEAYDELRNDIEDFFKNNL